MLAAGPWLMLGKDIARRVVLYTCRKNELVVHDEIYCPGATPNCYMTTGNYFKTSDMTAAVARWMDRSTEAMGLQGQPGGYVCVCTKEFADAASFASAMK